MADGTKKAVQNLKAGDQLRMYDINTNTESAASITEVRVVTVDNMLTLQTTAGTPFRADANPRLLLNVLVDGKPTLTPITEIKVGDRIFFYDTASWVPVTGISVAQGGHHVMYDPLTEPFGELIANGYLDCPCYLK